MKQSILLFFTLLEAFLFSQVPSNYYNSTTGLSGYTLKTELKNIISNNYNELSYGTLYNVYKQSDVDTQYENDTSLLDMYSEIPNGADSYSYIQLYSNTCTGGSNSFEGECFNREHLVPQAVFNYQFPMKSDAHFVVPTDGYVNFKRGSLAFGEVSNPIWTSTNGSKIGNNTTLGYSSLVFEPIDEFKGDIARMLFYFATRYEDSVATWNHVMFNNTSDQVFDDWFLKILLDWHENDPVSARDITRNNVIYSFQDNANPFIDHPEWVNLIWNPNPDTINPTAPANLTITNITSNSASLSWTAATDNEAVSGYDIYRDNTLISSVINTNYNDINLTENTDYTYYIVAKDASSNFSINSNIVDITTLNIQTILFNEDFEIGCNSMKFYIFNEASNKNWECESMYGFNDSKCMRMNGFLEDIDSKDWLISSEIIKFEDFENTTFSCFLAYAYGSMSLDLLYSTDWDNSTNPENFTWTAVPNVIIETSTGSSSQTIQNISNADISSISENAYIAFRYYSNGSPTRWTVDNVSISGTKKEELVDPTPSVIKENQNLSIKLFPNPSSSNSFTVNSNLSINEIHVYNSIGILLRKIKTTKKNYTVSKLEKGIYFVQISNNAQQIFERIIVK